MKPAKSPESDVKQNDLYSVVIYQNIPYIEGLYQQLHGGKPTEATVHRNDQTDKKVGGGAHAAGKLLGVIDLGADGQGSSQWGSDEGKSQTMTFDQAFLLHGVRTKLRNENQVKVIEDSGTYQSIEAGDFVEFRAKFEPNLLASMLDVFTPDIVTRIAFSQMAKPAVGQTDQDHKQAILDEATLNSQLAGAIYEAAQREFRNDSSAEFYGSIIGAGNLSVTAVTICDKSMFSNGDTDRILDGEFRVLGKAISRKEGYSMFERNKILSRLKPAAIEELQGKLQADTRAAEYVDTNLGLSGQGSALKVIPIAVFV